MRRLPILLATLGVLALIVVSLFVGSYDIDLRSLFTDPEARRMFFISRVPRTLALVLAAAAMAVSGVIMQMLVQNRFVEPTTTGTSEWAALGVLLLTLLAPAASPLLKMGAASAFAFLGAMVFLFVLQRIALKSQVIVPIVGIMLGALISSLTLYLASTYQLLQTLATWRSGGFSSVVRGTYEPLWVVGIIVIGLYLAADRFTIAGLGRDTATSLGLPYRRIMFIGLTMVALATGVTTVVVGFLPFLGLIIPNLVSMARGDDIRSNLPWVVLSSVALMIACDLVGRTLVAPLEIPATVVLGAVGAVVFVAMILRQRKKAHV
ncbi:MULTISPECIES: ABC transporter permease [Streptomyces]|uniref:Iron ABC transporter permease n=1 Tax=Streptomyces tsukubensis (strain DSM 42081 / NBRC 108919 / NRRL 18488 / 9993) TaxID=1114943 RepID=I2N7R5_STRT9|nr:MULTISPECIES: iron chelate uptake ABC transporter family permease subunit [Streptomyces]AZK96962.1 iron ABC transporter permease [Streptomyces tsukubensis]EIF93062.1 transporter permease [Streptomyces tsukubensis NRRL18488]MYS66443.1 iron chelate uptake ABC transporter family permease subunit [Streptomyces sp. SID5473]QKM67057.1 iron ABC transporter permease [Streptomyces tsukubensis NRRL18488]TAI41462.1 ABC transporter permease [Streptomyces tsukubensis]